jgi:arsenical pump membrane protein
VIPAGPGALRCGIIGTDDPGMPRRAQRGGRREEPGCPDRAAGALNGAAAEILAAVLLVVVLLSAASRRWWLPEPVAAVVAAAILMLTGVLPVAQARAAAGRLLPVLGFLAAILVLGALCERAGLFRAAGTRLATASRGSPLRLLGGVFGLASATTAVLSLDTTVVLLTPVVHETAGRLRVPPKPHVYACTHLANSASLLLPVSNLTNLLAFSVSGLTLTRFTALMALPWVVAIAVEYAGFRLFFAADLSGRASEPPPGRLARPAAEPDGDESGIPWFALITVTATLAGFVLTSFAGLNPAWAALAGVCVLGARELSRRQGTAADLIRAASVPFLLFVLGLGLVVQGVTAHGLGAVVGHLIPGGSSLLVLLAIAGVAAVLANAVNNLPAVLILLSVLAARGLPPPPGPLLAVLIGVNIGPNLSYTGSLANLLWRRLLAARDQATDLGEFTRLGLLTVPVALVLATVALWAGLLA